MILSEYVVYLAEIGNMFDRLQHTFYQMMLVLEPIYAAAVALLICGVLVYLIHRFIVSRSNLIKGALGKIDGVFAPLSTTIEKSNMLRLLAISVAVVTVIQVLTDISDRTSQRRETISSLISTAWAQLSMQNLNSVLRGRAFETLRTYDDTLNKSVIGCRTVGRYDEESKLCSQRPQLSQLYLSWDYNSNIPVFDEIDIFNSELVGATIGPALGLRNAKISDSFLQNSTILFVDGAFLKLSSVDISDKSTIDSSRVHRSIIVLLEDPDFRLSSVDISGSILFFLEDFPPPAGSFYASADEPPIVYSVKKKNPETFKIDPNDLSSFSKNLQFERVYDHSSIQYCSSFENEIFDIPELDEGVSATIKLDCESISYRQAKIIFPEKYTIEHERRIREEILKNLNPAMREFWLQKFGEDAFGSLARNE